MKTLVIFLSLAMYSTVTLGAECLISTTRYACPGKEAVSYKKCGGNQACDKIVQVKSENECYEAAVKACINRRFDTTKYKNVRAWYDGVDFAGIDFCHQDTKPYKVSRSFPFRDKLDCK